MHNATPDFLAILQVLHDHDVNFIVVGALSAVLQGAPIMTFDLDIVHQHTSENLDHLQRAIQELDAHYRGHSAHLIPQESHLRSAGHRLLSTKYGPLDLLGAIEDDLTYEDLLSHSIQLTLDDLSIRLLTLQKYVEMKERSSVEKDRARLPTLRQTLHDRNGSSG